jgi:plasmid maintenance system antidote protein VapI
LSPHLVKAPAEKNPPGITALRLGKFFGVSPEIWLGLQSDYELRRAERTFWREAEKRVHPYSA